MIRVRSLWIVVYLFVVPISRGQQEGTLKALLIGNSAYVVDPQGGDAQFAPLDPMPTNDVNGVYKALLHVGFRSENVTRKYNLGRDEFVTALANFAAGLSPGDKALFYFSV
jgi:hypothetical protein